MGMSAEEREEKAGLVIWKINNDDWLERGRSWAIYLQEEREVHTDSAL